MKSTNLSQRSYANQSGMTLIEIMIVLAILGSLIALLLPKLTGQLDKSKVNTTKIAISQISGALNMYYTDCGGFPQSLEGLGAADAGCSNWGPEAYMKKIPKDGWNRDFAYSVEGNSFVLKSLGADGREGGDGYGKDISTEDSQ